MSIGGLLSQLLSLAELVGSLKIDTYEKCEVKLFKAGTVFTEEVIAIDYQDARKVALARNPGAKIIGVTAVFK